MPSVAGVCGEARHMVSLLPAAAQICVLSGDTTSFSWSHCDAPLSFSCVLEEATPENKGACELSWVCLGLGFKPRHPDYRA